MLNDAKRVTAIAVAAALLFSLFRMPPVAAATVTIPYHRVTHNNTVCLTVDDGYGWKNQKRILDTLRKYNVKCTFFIIGEALLRNPNYWKQAIQDGNEICYHSMHHKNLMKMTNKQIQQDIDQWNATLAKVLPGYKSPKLARFPGGNGVKTARIMKIFAANGYQVITWSVQNVARKYMVAHMKHSVKKNSIILIHFDPANASALPKYIGYLKSHFKLGKVSEAFPDPAPAITPTPSPTPTFQPEPTQLPAPTPKAEPTSWPEPSLPPEPPVSVEPSSGEPSSSVVPSDSTQVSQDARS